jgi:hypothetical protein
MTQVIHETKFASKENLQKCLDIFTKYVADKQGITIKESEYSNLKRVMYETMRQVERTHGTSNSSTYDLNLIVLSSVEEAYKKKTAQQNPVMNVVRDRDVYGHRQVQINELIPQRDPYMKKNNSVTMPMDGRKDDRKDDRVEDRKISNRGVPHERMMQSADVIMSKVQEERAELTRVPMPDIRAMGQQIKEEPDDINDFAKKLEYLESLRTNFDRSIEKEFREANPIESQDLKKMYTTPSAFVQDGAMGSTQPPPSSRQQVLPMNPVTSSHVIPSPKTITIPRYVSINSTDREWNQNTKRYEYSVTFNGMGKGGMSTSRAFRNIQSIAVGKVIIPDEIIDNAKNVYNYEFSFSYPYIILQVSEFTDVYDGTNTAIQRGFCKLIYHRSYKAPNGRGYIILKPLQDEKKVFYPAPLSSLNRMSVSLLKPNGTLLNLSADSYKVLKVAYDASLPLYYQVTTDTYFDKNEFYVNDTILFRGFAVQQTNLADQEKQLGDFMNRAEGHEVVQIGTANANGFYNTFYIRAMGAFNTATGRYVVNDSVVNCINAYNASINWTGRTITNGYILNASLQNSIGMTVETVVNDATSKIETTLV